MPALQDLDTLERTTGVSGEIDVIVQRRDVATPAVIAWMTALRAARARALRLRRGEGLRARPTLCPALSLPDLFSGGTAGAPAARQRRAIDGLLDAVPPYFSQAVITPDRSDGRRSRSGSA